MWFVIHIMRNLKCAYKKTSYTYPTSIQKVLMILNIHFIKQAFSSPVQCFIFRKSDSQVDVVTYVCNPSNMEAETVRSPVCSQTQLLREVLAEAGPWQPGVEPLIVTAKEKTTKQPKTVCGIQVKQ